MAKPFTAGVVVTEMPSEQRFPFIAGIIEGLAIARFERDNPSTEGMSCIYEWLYTDTEPAMDKIYSAFHEFPDYPPASVISAMIRRECGR